MKRLSRLFSHLATDLSVDGDIEEYEEDERDDTVDEKVKIDEVNFDVKRVKSQRGRCNLFNLLIIWLERISFDCSLKTQTLNVNNIIGLSNSQCQIDSTLYQRL